MKRLWPLVLLAACSFAAPPVVPTQVPAVPDAAADTCGARPFEGLIGQPATALERLLIMQPIRILRPLDPVTEDYSAARLNIYIDGAERIGRLTCG